MKEGVVSDKDRCFGNEPGKTFYADYHDQEWAVPTHDERLLFEMLILEGAQAGLSWETILKRREAYRHLFHNFDPNRVAAMSDEELDQIAQNPEIIRHKGKIYAARQNAQIFLKIQEEFGSFDRYVWEFVDYEPIVNRWTKTTDVPTETEISKALSKDLKKRGMAFVGPTIVYAFMQAIGMVDDHLITCWLRKNR
ncbi:MAG: DNA-3-methyladenine glycosylase I [Chlamydiales bacterium]|nr:DNA-3-methyladenine glycosylase I [Chlamydiales bacterium]